MVSDNDPSSVDQAAQAADDGPESREDLMRATYRALCAHGYADLTMQDIADEAPVSKAALHYHYDSKRDLLSAFQAYISDRFLSRIRAADDPAADPADRLSAVLDAALSPPADDDLRDLQRALLELKAQAPYQPGIREQVERTDDAFRSLLTEIVADGVDSGAFSDDVDPASTAKFVATVTGGNQARQVSVGQSPGETRDLLRTHVEAQLSADRDGSDTDGEAE